MIKINVIIIKAKLIMYGNVNTIGIKEARAKATPIAPNKTPRDLNIDLNNKLIILKSI